MMGVPLFLLSSPLRFCSCQVQVPPPPPPLVAQRRARNCQTTAPRVGDSPAARGRACAPASRVCAGSLARSGRLATVAAAAMAAPRGARYGVHCHPLLAAAYACSCEQFVASGFEKRRGLHGYRCRHSRNACTVKKKKKKEKGEDEEAVLGSLPRVCEVG